MAALTWTGATNSDYNTGSNWTGGTGLPPQPADTITFSGSVPCNLGGNRTVQGLTFSGYTGSLNFSTFNLLVNGNLTLQPAAITTSGTGLLIIGATSTITPNGGTWSGNLQLGNATSITISLAGGFSVTKALSFASTVSLAGTTASFNITANGNVVANGGCIVSTTTTNPITLVLAGLTTEWSGSGRLGCNVQFLNASANFIVNGSVTFGSTVAASQPPQLQVISAASITTTSSTLNLIGNCTLSTASVTWNNVIFVNASATYTITCNENLNIGGSLTNENTNTLLARSSSVITINLNGNLNVNATLSTPFGTTFKIRVIGNSTLSTFDAGSFAQIICNVDIDIDASANTVALSNTANIFSFGNPSLIGGSTSPRLKYVSGTFTTSSRTIYLANCTLELAGQQLGNVSILPTQIFGNIGNEFYTVQLVGNTSISGNLTTRPKNYNGGGLINNLTGSFFDVNGSITTGGNTFSNLGGNTTIRAVGSGTISGGAYIFCNLTLQSGTYTINNLLYGNPYFSVTFPTTPTFLYVGGAITWLNSLIISKANLNLGAQQLNNLAIASPNSSNSGFTYFANIIGSVLRVNGNFTAGEPSLYGFTEVRADASTPLAQLDVYGSVTLLGNIGFAALSGNSRIYMRGTGTLSGGVFNGNGGYNIDIFIQGVAITIGNAVFTPTIIGKRLEYISTSSSFNTSTGLISIANTLTIKSLGQNFGDVLLNGNIILEDNLTLSDLSTAGVNGATRSISGTGLTLTIKRNLTLNDIGGVLTTLVGTPISKIIMDASETGTGTWSSNSQPISGIDFDLNAPTRTINVTGTVGFNGSGSPQKTLKWFSGTTISAAGSTLTTNGGIFDLGNQAWGSFTIGGGATVNLTSDANFTNVTVGSVGTNVTLNGLVSAKVLTINGNYTLNSTSLITGVIPVSILYNGSGSWTSSGTTILDIALASGTRTLVGTIAWGGNKVFTATGGSLVSTGSTFNIIGSNTIAVDRVTIGSFNNVTTSANTTTTLNAQMGILGTLALSSTAANTTIFASSSTFGWNAVNFTHGGGNTICILNAGSTYNVSGTFTMLGSSNTVRATLRSSKLSSFTGTANGTTLTLAAPPSGTPIEPNMVLSQASGVAPLSSFGAMLPNRPIIQSGAGLSWVLDPTYPVPASTGSISMEAGIKANFNLAAGTGNALVLNATTKDINSIGGQTIYAFQTYTDAPTNPQADLYRTINWNSLLPPASPIGVGFLSVT